ncbi:hypothetical protein [Rhizobium laguerreae]|uniref:hypothetical protein n=1 Tax=Rhizobium laguerreae TaxID=1076926 RepID=UPI001C90DE53|nr:hypothetical protein [Rhizobium laguerreae]MBY3562568.1 hypothetical protein [Rhizobium laguerreae]
MLLQYADDLFVCETIALHPLVLSNGPELTSKWIISTGQGHGDKLRALVTSQPYQFRKLLVDEGISAANIMAAMTAQQCDNLLSTGQLHIYRGTLSDRGHGYLALFRHCVKLMVGTGHMEKAYAEELEGNLREAIREVG